MPFQSERRDYSFVNVCQNCYLTCCLYESHYLGIYCSEAAGKRRKLAPEVVAKVSREVGTNRRHEFIRRLNENQHTT